MAWLVAYNDGLLDATQPAHVTDALEKLLQWVRATKPALTESRDRWSAAVRDALAGSTA
jgi:hypothetical protein